mmetsp:Transcript_3385/g.5773  ORF Transcript_3385/g.5773 Transcript_3385/m.5773 type:complete len:215 (-) Transcript_3385:471-1115(-)
MGHRRSPNYCKHRPRGCREHGDEPRGVHGGPGGDRMRLPGHGREDPPRAPPQDGGYGVSPAGGAERGGAAVRVLDARREPLSQRLRRPALPTRVAHRQQLVPGLQRHPDQHRAGPLGLPGDFHPSGTHHGGCARLQPTHARQFLLANVPLHKSLRGDDRRGSASRRNQSHVSAHTDGHHRRSKYFQVLASQHAGCARIRFPGAGDRLAGEGVSD